jgi:hypothetical protein
MIFMKKQSAVKKPARTVAPAYKNPSLPSARRVRDLLSRMTLEEKAAQMMCVWQEKAQKLVDEKGDFDEDEAKKAFRDRRGVGQVGRPSDAGGGKTARGMAASTATLLPKAPASRSPSRWAQPSILSWSSPSSP